MAYPRTARRTLQRLLVVLCVVGVGLLPAAHAHADPTITEIEQQIQQLWNKVEPLIEQYNKVHSELLASQAKSAEIDKLLAPLQTEASIGRARVGYLASQYYRSGRTSMINALLSNGNARNITGRLEALELITRSRNQDIGATNAASEKYRTEKANLDQLIAAQKKNDDDLAAQKKVIEAQLGELQKMRLRAYGSNGPGGSLKIGSCPAVTVADNVNGQTAAEWSCTQIGKPYVWNTEGPNTYDCSGLTKAAWKFATGKSLTHYTGSQWKEGSKVSRANARPGDLVFFGSGLSHVGVYVGNGLMVHAPNSTDVVRMAKIDSMGMSIAGFVRPFS
jgi:cell wall-associated NlpC family hydrolase